MCVCALSKIVSNFPCSSDLLDGIDFSTGNVGLFERVDFVGTVNSPGKMYR